MARVRIDAGGCWIWTGTLNENGYGVIKVGGRSGRTHLVHRFLDALRNGTVPKGIEVMHTCDTPPCVSPDHLVRGTHRQNMADMDAKGRCKRGGKGRRFSPDEVALILTSDKSSYSLGAYFGVDGGMIRKIRRQGGYLVAEFNPPHRFTLSGDTAAAVPADT